MSEKINLSIAIINQIITMQSSDDQRAILHDLFSRFGWPDREEYRIMTDKDVAERYGVMVQTVQYWLLDGELQGFKKAKKWYTRSDWLRDFENRNAQTNQKYKTKAIVGRK